jgi:hypothetical protein
MLLLGRWEWIIKGNLAQLLQFQRGEHKQRGTNCVLQVRTDGSTDSSTDSSTDGSTDGSTHGSTNRSTDCSTDGNTNARFGTIDRRNRCSARLYSMRLECKYKFSRRE